MKVTKGIISKAEAKKLASDYVRFHAKSKARWKSLDRVIEVFDSLRRGSKVIAFVDGKFVIARVTSKTPGFEGEPIVRVSNGEFSWRVDGDTYAYPID